MAGRTFALILLAHLLPAHAAADWMVSPHVGARFAGATNYVLGGVGAEKNRFGFGSSIGFLGAGILGVEADVAFVPGFFNGPSVTTSMVTTVMGNVIVAAPLDVTQYGLRPYLTSGAGWMRARGDASFGPVISPVISGNLFGMNVGGGAIGPISPRLSLRFDLRYFRNLTGDAESTIDRTAVALSFWRGTVGLTFRF